MKRFPEEHKAFILTRYRGISAAALAEALNEEFSTSYTAEQIKAYKSRYGLQSGLRGRPAGYCSSVFPEAVRDYIVTNCNGVGTKEMTDKVNARFGTSYRQSQLKSFYSNHGLRCGLDMRFRSGNPSHNKGRKGWRPTGCEKSWFHKGHTPLNQKPVGSETFRKDGYWWIKVAEPNVWQQKHVVIWEARHGKRPPGMVISFLDGDRHNLSEDNLALISRGEHGVMAKNGLRRGDADITRTGILLARLKIARTALRKSIKKRR